MSARQGAFLCCDDRASGAPDCEHTGRHVYFCIRLSEAALETSAVLDGLCSAPGVATLPTVVSEEDFLLWSKCNPRSPPKQIEDLVKVLRVADALSDKRMPAWVEVMAEHAAYVRWRSDAGIDLDSREVEIMHAALLSLSPDVRTSVLRNFIENEPQALGLLPQTLHPYVVAAMIDSDGSLSCPTDFKLLRNFMSQLRSLPGCGHPPLQSLDLMPMEAQPSACHVIVDALPNNPRLSSLHLNLPGDVPVQMSAISVLCSSLAAATSLRDIRLCQNEFYIPLAALAPLVRALPALPSLERLHLHDIACCTPEVLVDSSLPDDAPTQAEADELRGHWRRLLAAAASHPGLTCLSLACKLVFEPLPWPDEFPRLQELHMRMSLGRPDHDIAKVALKRIINTQTRLPYFPALSHLGFKSSSAHGEAVPALAPYWLPNGRGCLFPAMRSMDLDVKNVAFDKATAFWRVVVGGFDACPGLEDLSISSSHHDIMAAMVCRRLCSLPNTSLRSLHLEGPDDTATSISPEQTSDAATAILGLGSIRSLSLNAARDPVCCYALRAVQNLPFGSLPDLTRLCFRMHSATTTATCRESTAGVVEVLQKRTGLRSVDMVKWVLSKKTAKQLWDALVSMPHLQELALHSTELEVPEAGVRGLAAALPRMKALTFLDMRPVWLPDLVQFSRDLDVVELLARELGRRGAVRRRPLRLVYGGLGHTGFKEFEQAAAAVNVHCVNASVDNGYNLFAYE